MPLIGYGFLNCVGRLEVDTVDNTIVISDAPQRSNVIDAIASSLFGDSNDSEYWTLVYHSLVSGKAGWCASCGNYSVHDNTGDLTSILKAILQVQQSRVHKYRESNCRNHEEYCKYSKQEKDTVVNIVEISSRVVSDEDQELIKQICVLAQATECYLILIIRPGELQNTVVRMFDHVVKRESACIMTECKRNDKRVSGHVSRDVQESILNEVLSNIMQSDHTAAMYKIMSE